MNSNHYGHSIFSLIAVDNLVLQVYARFILKFKADLEYFTDTFLAFDVRIKICHQKEPVMCEKKKDIVYMY